MAIRIRPGTTADLRAAFDVFVVATADVDRRLGQSSEPSAWGNPVFVEGYWSRRRPLLEHLARTAEHWYVAEDDGLVVGYARATLHDGVRELTEFHVRPDRQSQGIGRQLLERAFPAAGARHRAILASTDVRALARYLQAGVYPRFPVYHLARAPAPVTVSTDLTPRRVPHAPETAAQLRVLDRAVLDFTRDETHEFLASDDRELYFYTRDGAVVAYAYFGSRSGPIAVLDEGDLPAVLAHGETLAAARGDAEYGVQVPLINSAAVDYLLARRFRLEPFTVLFMSDAPFGRFENYILTIPDFFL